MNLSREELQIIEVAMVYAIHNTTALLNSLTLHQRDWGDSIELNKLLQEQYTLRNKISQELNYKTK